MIIEQIPLENGTAIGLKLEMQNAPLLVIRADKGFVMCGYLDTEMANKLGDVAAKVRGVNNFEDVLHAEVLDVTNHAKAIGIKAGMKGHEALELMF
ncbi:YunC family protein [Methanococcoides sp. AM1]|uniref:YunC family protein n=1 Tax=Methanococcoides sp. AM1 TaxID=1201011 RepID=UPI0010833040|nr:DUF1805 domain-containing protein [Methanococcoides sp. AM1]